MPNFSPIARSKSASSIADQVRQCSIRCSTITPDGKFSRRSIGRRRQAFQRPVRGGRRTAEKVFAVAAHDEGESHNQQLHRVGDDRSNTGFTSVSERLYAQALRRWRLAGQRLVGLGNRRAFWIAITPGRRSLQQVDVLRREGRRAWRAIEMLPMRRSSRTSARSAASRRLPVAKRRTRSGTPSPVRAAGKYKAGAYRTPARATVLSIGRG